MKSATPSPKKKRKKMSEKEVETSLPVDSVMKPIGDLTIFEAAQFHEDLKALEQQEGPLETRFI